MTSNLEQGYPDGPVAAMLEALPELRGAYDSQPGAFEGKPYTAFGVLLNPLLWKLLSSSGTEAQLDRVFAFIEKLANDSDNRVRTLVAIEVLEALAGEKIADRAVTHMGPSTRALFVGREHFIAAARRGGGLLGLFQSLGLRIHSLRGGRRGAIQRVLEELRSTTIVRPDDVEDALRPAALEVMETEDRLVHAAERYLQNEPYPSELPLGRAPSAVRTGDWQDRNSATAASVLRGRWRRLQRLAEALSR